MTQAKQSQVKLIQEPELELWQREPILIEWEAELDLWQLEPALKAWLVEDC